MLPRWPGRCMALLLGLILLGLLLASRQGWSTALQADVRAVHQSTGPLVAGLAGATAQRLLRWLPGACPDVLMGACAALARNGPANTGLANLPVHLVMHGIVFSLWVGLLWPLGQAGLARRDYPGAGSGALSPAAAMLQELPAWRILLSWCPVLTLLWACLPQGFGWAPFWALVWLRGAGCLCHGPAAWRDG